MEDSKTIPPGHASLRYREEMKEVGNFLKTQKFPAYKDHGEKLKDRLRNITEPILENETYFHYYLDDIVKLFCIICKVPHSDQQEKLLNPVKGFFEGLRRKEELLVNKPEYFRMYAPMLTNLVRDIPSADCMGEVIKYVGQYFITPISANNPENGKKCADFMAACLTHADVRCVEMCQTFLKANKKALNWKDNVDGARVILISLGAVKIKKKDRSEESDLSRSYGHFVEDFLKQLKFCKVLGKVQKEMLALLKQILDTGNEVYFEIGKKCAQFIELKEDLSLALPLVKTMDRQFKNKDFPWHHSCCFGICLDTLSKIIESHKDPEQFPRYAPYFVSIFKTAMKRDHYDDDSESRSVFGDIFIGPLMRLAGLYQNTKDHGDLKPLIGDVVTLLKSDDEHISSSAGRAFQMLSMSNPASFAPYLSDIVESLIQNQDSTLLSVIEAAYKLNPQPVDDRLEEVFDILEGIEKNYESSLISLLKEVAEHNPKLFTKKQVNRLINDYLDYPMTACAVLQLLQSLANQVPGIVEPYINTLFSEMKSMYGATMIPNILTSLAQKNKKLVKPVFNQLIEHLQSCKEDYTHLTCALNAIRMMGMKDREILNPHKQLFESLAEKHPVLKDMCKFLVDVIEGKSFEDITEKVEQHDDDINVLDSRVTNTENDVNEIGQEVESQGKQVGQLKEDVVKQEERIDEIEEVVDDTVEKVEEIDKKTLSNAPAWSRDVSILLNPEAEHDWRLLAQRLGYTPEDIRGWATQHDPCMSLLSEWFATHKTSEATKAVLKTLEEMNRLDAAEIVGRAMQAVENVVQDEPPDYETPPPVFISYQWGHQPEVRLFRKHLEMAGFASWMDIGQMGGGDKLYAKIDQGIRAAQVVICCVTEKYAKSPNCNREVNLAVNLGKPIIPLLLENVAWPPPGAMGPIFGEYLYIKFFQSGAEADTKDERVWPATSFQELLMQLSYMKLIPEQLKITKPYVNWWLPPEEVIVVRKKSNVDKTSKSVTKSEEIKETEAQPEVFISYQWGIQPQVKALYKRMCGLGYHCWMDIHQMGGGDSLYDKIDRGVRGSKVVLSCVTEKYSKSANCRREVSLADALKKPIIPLLLEDTVWPPSGPMSMVFTQLLYIDLKRKETQESWSGAPFDEVLRKVEGYLCGENEKSALNPGQPKSGTVPAVPYNQTISSLEPAKEADPEKLAQATSLPAEIQTEDPLKPCEQGNFQNPARASNLPDETQTEAPLKPCEQGNFQNPAHASNPPDETQKEAPLKPCEQGNFQNPAHASNPPDETQTEAPLKPCEQGNFQNPAHASNPPDETQNEAPLKPCEQGNFQNPADASNPPDETQKEAPLKPCEQGNFQNPAHASNPPDETQTEAPLKPCEQGNFQNPSHASNQPDETQKEAPFKPCEQGNFQNPAHESNPPDETQKEAPLKPCEQGNFQNPAHESNPPDETQKEAPLKPCEQGNFQNPAHESNPPDETQKEAPLKPCEQGNFQNPAHESNPPDETQKEILFKPLDEENCKKPVQATNFQNATQTGAAIKPAKSAISQNKPEKENLSKSSPSSGSPTTTTQMSSSPTLECRPQSSQVAPTPARFTQRKQTRSKSCLIL